jgi:hypothetical protein
MLAPHRVEMLCQRGFHRLRRHGDAVLGALAVPDDDLVRFEVDVMNAETSPSRRRRPAP